MLLYMTIGTNDLTAPGVSTMRYCRCSAIAASARRGTRSVTRADEDVRCRFWVVTPFDGRPATDRQRRTMCLRGADAERLSMPSMRRRLPPAAPMRARRACGLSMRISTRRIARDLDGNKIVAVCERPE